MRSPDVIPISKANLALAVLKSFIKEAVASP